MIAKNVKKVLIDKELSVTKLAEITGYTRGHICNVINGHIDSPRAKKMIALALNREFGELWNHQVNNNL